VLIIIATDIIGGPGKGLFQFFKHAPAGEFDYILCNFNVRNRPFGQFINEAHRKNLNLVLLNQHATIDPSLLFQARKVLLETGANIVQTHGYKSNLIGFLLRRVCSHPWIGFAHGYTDDSNKIRFYNMLDRAVLGYADRVVTVSGSTKRLLVRSGVKESRISLIYNAVDPDEDKPTLDSHVVKKNYGIRVGQKVVGVVGRLNPEKGQLVFLKAFRSVLKIFPDVKALIIGDGQDRRNLEDYCKQNGMDGNVVFTGYQENMANFYQVLDILVLPSLSEGLPNAVLEAMSFGVPVVAASVGGVPEVIYDENGVLVPPGDHEALADRMTKLLRNDQLRQALGVKGRNSLYPNFSPSYRAQQIVELYKDLLSS
jgi:glycosyltransferase involved in cell wall biosynthesis